MEDANITEENAVKEEIDKEENSSSEENTSSEENIEEKTMTESEYIEAQKEAFKKNIRIWTGVLIYILVAGVITCILVYGFIMLIMFVINLLFFLKTKKFLKQIENGEAGVKEIYEYYESISRRSGLFFVLNLFCAGGFGLIGTIHDMRISAFGMEEGEKILGDDYKNERIANDANAQWNYCIYCKRNKTETFFRKLYRMQDGVICDDCLSPYTSMLPKRTEDPALLKHREITHCANSSKSVGKLSSKDLEERLEYLKKNQEDYSGFTPTRVICDGCLELDETNSLFRIATASEFNSTTVGEPSGLVHPYSAVKGIAYEMVYEYVTPNDDNNGGWTYENYNSIIFAIDNPYLKEETFALAKVPTKFFESSKKPQNEYAEQTVKELSEIFNAPVLESRKLHR